MAKLALNQIGGVPASGQVLKSDGSAWAPGTDETATGAGSGDVVGPASATDAAFPRFSGTGGKTIADSPLRLSSTADLTKKLALDLTNIPTATERTIIVPNADITLIGTSDSRLSDARTPTAHAASHITGGSDKIRDCTSGQDGLMTTAFASKLNGIASGATVAPASLSALNTRIGTTLWAHGSGSGIVVTATTPYDVPSTVSTVYMGSAGGPKTVVLPASAGLANGRWVLVVDISGTAGANPISIVPNGSDTIFGGTDPVVIDTPRGAVWLQFITSNWFPFMSWRMREPLWVPVTAVKTGAYTIGDYDHTVPCDSSANTFTVTMPSAAVAGRKVSIFDAVGACAMNNVTIARAGSDTIHGLTSISLAQDWASVDLVAYAGSKWKVL